jgi:glycosyltransferase involved in cell wall biosynthesis
MSSSYKYFLSVCVCIKNERKYIEPFIKHYLLQDVDHIYIINNGSDDGIEEYINSHIFKNSITLINDPRDLHLLTNNSGAEGHKKLLDENLYALIKAETEWACIVDADEYMFGKNGHTLRSFLKTSIDSSIGCIYVIWNIINPVLPLKTEFVFGNQRLNYDRFSDYSHAIQNANNFGKSIVRTSMLLEDRKLWIHKIQVNGVSINNYGKIDNTPWYDNCNDIDRSEEAYENINITLHHYAIRNQEDYNKKTRQLTLVTNKTYFINGLLEMLELDANMLVAPGR